MELGKNIYECRTGKNWSQSELAEALNVSRQSVSKWENGMAIPDVDKLIKMSELFDITLDELVFGLEKETPNESVNTGGSFRKDLPPVRIISGIIIMLFGMVFFLLSVFWGDHLSFGEEFGELVSLVIVLLSISLLATYHFKVWSVCAVVYALYSLVCFGIFNVSSLTNYAFTFVAGLVLLVWFIVWGLSQSKKEQA